MSNFEISFWAMATVAIFAIVASIYATVVALRIENKNKTIFLIALAATWTVVFLSLFLNLSTILFITERQIPFF
jgi:uncharacterized membrane protein